jgi:hypothetical protein
VFQESNWIVKITSVPKVFDWCVHIRSVSTDNDCSVCWSTLLVVVTTNGVPSGSISPAFVKSLPTVGVSSVVVFYIVINYYIALPLLP